MRSSYLYSKYYPARSFFGTFFLPLLLKCSTEIIFLNTCHWCNEMVLVGNHPVDIFGERSSKEIKFGNGLRMKLCQPYYGKVKNILEFHSLLHASLLSQEFSIGTSCVKRVQGSQQVGDSPSSSQQA